MQKNIAVFFGGNSNEREISVITGLLAVNLLRGSEYRVIPVYLRPEGGMVTGEYRSPADFRKGASIKETPVRLGRGCLLREKRARLLSPVDCALNCCHGGLGEDGTLSALLTYYKINSASPEAPMSAIGMDKTLTKLMAKGLGVPTVRGFSVTEKGWEKREEILKEAANFGYPLIVKPAKLGSSIGIKVAKDEGELVSALELAFRLDRAALVEEYLKNKRDINCAACRVGGEIALSPLEEVFSSEDILTFSEKYEPHAGRHSQMPADLPEEIAEKICAYTKKIYDALGGRGVVRADFLVAEGAVYFNELNTVPGSLSCYLFGKSLTENKYFLLSLIEEALKDPPREKETISSGILEKPVFSGKASKR